MKISISELDLSLQTRAGTDAETIDNYAEAMADGAAFPPVVVFKDNLRKRLYLADGFHRVMAAKQNGKTAIPAIVHEGTEEDAIVFGGTANNKQGKRPTRADVQHFLEMVWERREKIFGGTPTGGNLAEKCGVSRATGNRFVKEKLAAMPAAPTRAPKPRAKAAPAPVRPTKLIGADGKQYAAPPVRKGAPQPLAPTPTRAPKPLARAGYAIGKDGKEHAIGVKLDRFDVEIPAHLKAAFDTAQLDEWAHIVGTVKNAIKGLQTVGVNPVAATLQRAVMALDNAYHEIKAARPYCVCRLCQGAGCKACADRGYQTEDQYNRNPREFRA